MGEDWGNHVDLSASSVGTGRSAEPVYLLISHPSRLLYELGSSWMFHGHGSYSSAVLISLSTAYDVIFFCFAVWVKRVSGKDFWRVNEIGHEHCVQCDVRMIVRRSPGYFSFPPTSFLLSYLSTHASSSFGSVFRPYLSSLRMPHSNCSAD